MVLGSHSLGTHFKGFCILFDLVFVLGGYGNANEGSGKAIVPLVFVLILFLITYGKTLERLHLSRCLNPPFIFLKRFIQSIKANARGEVWG